MRRIFVVALTLMLVTRAEARVQSVDPTGTWEIAGGKCRVVITWNDSTACNLDFGGGRYAVAYREHHAYVGAMGTPDGDVALFRITGFGDGEVQVAWRDSWTSTNERAEHWVASRGVTTYFDGLPMTAAPEWPEYGSWTVTRDIPEIRRRIEPVVPTIAQEAGVDGTVVMQALIGRSGGVRDVRVTKSIPMLDATAIQCLRQWEFEPAKRDGKRVPAWIEIRMPFKLK